MTPTREQVDQYLQERGYRSYPIHAGIDRHDCHWQSAYREGGGKRFIDIRRWDHDKPEYAPQFRTVPDGYEVGVRFYTGLGWANAYFYGLDAADLLARLPELEGKLRALRDAWGRSDDD